MGWSGVARELGQAGHLEEVRADHPAIHYSKSTWRSLPCRAAVGEPVPGQSVQVLDAAGRALPQVHAIAKNRLTQYMGPSSPPRPC